MKLKTLLFIILVNFLIVPSVKAGSIVVGNTKAEKAMNKAIEKERADKTKADQKYLKRAKKEFWKSQSKQVKKTLRMSQRRNDINDRGYI